MSLAETVLIKLGARFAKIILKRYLNDTTEAIGADLLETVQARFNNSLDQREAVRQFEGLGERIAAELLPLFNDAIQKGHLNVSAITVEIAAALEGQLSVELLLSKDLDPLRLAAELERVHPLPVNQYSEAEEELYERALIEAARYLVNTVSTLPRFDASHAHESLLRLTVLRGIMEDTLLEVRRIQSWISSLRETPESRDYELDYRLAVVRKLNYVELFGADISPESKRLPLSATYVTLNLHSDLEFEKPELLTAESTLAKPLASNRRGSIRKRRRGEWRGNELMGSDDVVKISS